MVRQHPHPLQGPRALSRQLNRIQAHHQGRFWIPEFGHLQTKRQRRTVLHQRKTVNIPTRRFVQDADYRVGLLELGQLLQPPFDGPKLRSAIREVEPLVPILAVSVVDACRRGRSSVDADVHPKLNPVASFHAVIFLVARHHHLGHRLGRDPSDHEPRQPLCPNHGTKVKQKKCKPYPYNADGFCILGYGYDSPLVFRVLLLLLPTPDLGQVCNRVMT